MATFLLPDHFIIRKIQEDADDDYNLRKWTCSQLLLKQVEEWANFLKSTPFEIDFLPATHEVQITLLRLPQQNQVDKRRRKATK